MVEPEKVFKHYGGEEYYELIKEGKIESVDFRIGKKEDIRELTADMAGFGTEKSQRVIIEFDPEYDFFIAKRIYINYQIIRNLINITKQVTKRCMKGNKSNDWKFRKKDGGRGRKLCRFNKKDD